MRTPPGFAARKVAAGLLFVRADHHGSWVILAADPQIKIDNIHRDGRPHMHIDGWNSGRRVDLEQALSAERAAAAVAAQLQALGHIDVAALVEALR